MATFVVGRGMIGGHDDNHLATFRGWRNSERSEPVPSSLWTLNWRERYATGASAECYLRVATFVWFFPSLGTSAAKNELLPVDGGTCGAAINHRWQTVPNEMKF